MTRFPTTRSLNSNKKTHSFELTVFFKDNWLKQNGNTLSSLDVLIARFVHKIVTYSFSQLHFFSFSTLFSYSLTDSYL